MDHLEILCDLNVNELLNYKNVKLHFFYVIELVIIWSLNKLIVILKVHLNTLVCTYIVGLTYKIMKLKVV